jgi:lipopolysaccharide transport system ATP-binding protein
MTQDIAIRVQGLSKCYQIYDNPGDRLKQFVYPRIKRLLGRAVKPYFRDFWAVKDVSFEVKRGETVGIIGRNGSGKSTLLQMICGTLTPTGGTIQTHGRIAALLELGSGFNPEFTGRENIFLNAAVMGMTKEEIDTRYDAIVEFSEIGDFIDQPVKSYSSGMYVRLAFSVAVHVDPEILIIDEALSVGDIFFQTKCMRMMHDMMNRGVSVLFVTHDTNTVKSFCDRAVYLENGHQVAFDKTEKVVELYYSI